MINVKSKDGIEFLQFERLLEFSDKISHAYVLKPLDFRNHNGNEAILSYKAIFNELGMNINNLVRPHQMHTNNVICVKEKVIKDAPDVEIDYLENVDGVISDSNDIALATTNADCILFLVYDPVKNVVANVHSGWRGTFGKIIEVTINLMVDKYSSNPEDIIVCICPSIRKCHFEVDEDVKSECERIFGYTNRLDEIIQRGKIKDGKQKYNIDSVLINKILLKDLRIKDENIVDSGICSVCDSDKIHSRRADGLDFGLGTAIIQLNN